MTHPLIEQLRFTRAEWQRGLSGIPDADGVRRFEPMNSIGWIVAHLAWQEQRTWLTRAQGVTPVPILDEVAPNGGPPTTPNLPEMLAAWRTVTLAADPWLDALTGDTLPAALGGAGPRRTVADAVQRVTYHYWFHIGEILAIRQMLGHRGLPEFVGDLDTKAPWRPDPG